MKKYIISSVFLLILLMFQGTAREGRIFAQDNHDIMHPQISLLDIEGNVITNEGGKISTERTCGQCHDTRYINNHNNHFTSIIKADCIVCHFKESRMGSDYTAAHLRIQLPTNENCAQCHGLVQVCAEPLFIPGDYQETIEYEEGKKYYGITQHTGVILAPQNLANSSVNLKNKNQLHFPWDVHSRRQLDCIACHFISNDPRYCGNIRSSLDHLTMDPRRIKSPGEILKRPDHNLKVSSCTCCHNAFNIHKNLPYKKRHMEVLSCQSCHVPKIYGPAFQTVDQTVITADGSVKIEYRGVDETQSHGTSLSTKYFHGYRPFLFLHQNQPGDTNEQTNKYKISPFNLVTHWYWKSKKTGEPVSVSLLSEVYLDKIQSRYEEYIFNTFDKNEDQIIDARELVLDTDEKIRLIAGKLKESGIEEPVIAGEINAYKINHGVVEAMHMKRDCSHCHSPESKFGQEVLLASYSPGGILPEFSQDTLPLVNGNVILDNDGRVVLERTASITGHYVFGHGRIRMLDLVGLWIFILALLGIIAHGILRYYFSLKNPAQTPKSKKVYMYRFYERLWHWTMATGIIILALTGLEIHYTGSFILFGLEYAVAIHNVLAAILVINAALSLFYHLTTGEIRQFFGFNRKFIKEAVVQIYYYIYGIFKGLPHPVNKTEKRKLNPLQQLTYIGLLNILLPFQVITGILIWGTEKWPLLSEKLGGLAYLAPIHNFGSWLFLSFIVVHIYLTTTGHTVFSNIRAMITGYDDVEESEPYEENKKLMEMKMMDMVGTIINKIIKREKPSVSGGK